MTAEQIIESLLKHYGWTAFLVAIVLLIIFWAIVHWLSEPGKKISFLLGIVSYTKKYRRASSSKRNKPIDVIDEPTDTVWRIVSPVKNWIDSDISSLSPGYVSSMVIGPYHEKCKEDLSYFSRPSNTWCVRRRCRECDVEILPNSVTNNRNGMKTYVLQRLQQLHLQGTKIKNGMKI